MRSLSLSLVFLVVMSVAVDVALGQDWTRFRGPNGEGGSEATTIPSSIGESDYNWKVSLRGVGHSSPVLWGQRIFLMSSDADTADVYLNCLSAESGEVIWQQEFEMEPHHLHSRSSYASGTPAVDAEQVYFAWAEPTNTTLAAFTHDGEPVWARDLGSFTSQHGFGGSPMLYGEYVIFFDSQQGVQLAESQVPGESSVVALDRRTGETVWETPLSTTRVCYSVPCVYVDADGNEHLACCNTGNGIFAVDPADGRLVWELGVFRMRTVASTVTANGLILGSNGSGGGWNYLVAVRPGDEPAEAYRLTTSANYVPTPIVYGDLLFLFNDKGIASCVNVESGELYWRERLSDAFSGSPVRVQNRLYCIAEDGELFEIAATEEFELLGRHSLGEMSYSTPAISEGKMYLRTRSHLICVGGNSDSSQ